MVLETDRDIEILRKELTALNYDKSVNKNSILVSNWKLELSSRWDTVHVRSCLLIGNSEFSFYWLHSYYMLAMHQILLNQQRKRLRLVVVRNRFLMPPNCFRNWQRDSVGWFALVRESHPRAHQYQLTTSPPLMTILECNSLALVK